MLSDSHFHRLLSDSDFHRLINDPRLGEVERFFTPTEFQPIQLRCPTSPQFTQKSKRCGHCSNCRMKDCGDCIQCLDKPKFGGSGTRKQSCNRRRPCEKSAHKQSKVVAHVKHMVVSMAAQCFACNGKHRRHTCGAQNTVVSTLDSYDTIDTVIGTEKMPSLENASAASSSPRSSRPLAVLQISTPPAVLEVVS